MKKIISLALVVIMLVCALASCSNISESYAEKINEAAKNKEYYSLEDVKDDLGEDIVDLTILGNGVVIAVKGCSSIEDLEAKIENGDTVKGIVITFVLEKATAAVYKEISSEDLK